MSDVEEGKDHESYEPDGYGCPGCSKCRPNSITDFITKHNISLYKLSQLLDVPQTTIQRWCKTGPQHPVIMEMALKELGKRVRLKNPNCPYPSHHNSCRCKGEGGDR